MTTLLVPTAPPAAVTPPRALRPYQIEAADMVVDGWKRGVQGPAVVLPTGAGKPLHNNTDIPLPDGKFVKMGRIAVGDKVVGSDGNPTLVVAVEPQGVIPLYRMIFDDGTEVLAGAGHLWTAQRKSRTPRTVTTEWLAGLSPGVLGDWTVPAHKPGGVTERRSIAAVIKAGSGPATCIQVSNDDGLFACTRNYVMTHNSTVIAELTRREVVAGGRVLLLAHRNELIEQMADAAMAVNPTGPVPSMIGGPHRGDPDSQIVSATVQSLQRPGSRERLGHRDLLIIDEAHHAVAQTYLNVIEHFSVIGARRAGFTATMVRLAPKEGEPPLRSVWGEVVYERDINWAITNGFLLPPYGVTVQLPNFDLDAMHTGGGDITDDEAEAAMMSDATLNATVTAVVERTAGLSTIVFGASMDHCRAVADELIKLGVAAEVVVGTTSSKERKGIYRRFHNGQTRVLVTVDVLTEGADFPRCEAVVLARPTRSQSRLVQCVGRGLRPHTFTDGRVKDRALVVDLVGAGQMGLIVQVELDKVARGCECSQPCSGDCDESCTGLECRCVCDCSPRCICAQPCEGDCHEFCTGVGCACDCDCSPCTCVQPCGGACNLECTGERCGCDCECSVSIAGPAPVEEVAIECTCGCPDSYDLCRCGCACDLHRIEPLEDYDPVTGELHTQRLHRGDSAWSQRTTSIRWARHDRGLVRPIYRRNGSKGVLMLADMRGVAGTVPGHDWAFGFYDTDQHRAFWINTAGQWQEPGSDCYLNGFSLREADTVAQSLFSGHMRDNDRTPASDAQVDYATRIGIPNAAGCDRRDMSDLIALTTADRHMLVFVGSTQSDTAA